MQIHTYAFQYKHLFIIPYPLSCWESGGFNLYTLPTSMGANFVISSRIRDNQGMKLTLLILLFSVPPFLHAGEVKVAVAANFLNTLHVLAPLFEQQSGHRLLISAGSTGKLYAQLHHGAPYDVFLAADDKHPALLEKEGLVMPGRRITYALGRLVLWSGHSMPLKPSEEGGAQILQQSGIRHVAIANPATAPYGRAAYQALNAMELWHTLKSRIVRGEDVGQVLQFVASGNAQLGFVALAQIRNQSRNPKNTFSGDYWRVPEKFYDPIVQDLVLLKKAENNSAAHAFVAFMQTVQARALIQTSGYGVK